jgi:two-component system OmpR family sensor kinase
MSAMRGSWFGLRRQRTVGGRLVVESSLVLTGLVGAGLVAWLVGTLVRIDHDAAHDLLSLLAADLGAAAVVLGQTSGRLTGNRRASLVIPAFALYCGVIVPIAALAPAGPADAGTSRTGMLVAVVGVAVLLVMALRPPARAGLRVGWVVAGTTAAAALLITVLASVFPGSLSALPVPQSLNLGVLAAWCVVSSGVVLAGYRAGSPPVWRVGLGFGGIAAAHLFRALAPLPQDEAELYFVTLRLVGVAGVLLGMTQLLRRSLTVVVNERFDHQEALRRASLHAEELARSAAERDHELRNGLSALIGVSRLLEEHHERVEDHSGAGQYGHRSGAGASAALRRELDRLHDLVNGHGRRRTSQLYDATQVVCDLVGLWKVAGLRVDMAPTGAHPAIGHASTLAQVMTNLLTNCARHAPGAAVTVGVHRAGDVVRVQVSDEGGAQPAAGGAQRAGGPGADGQGLGLRISRRLLADEGGRLLLPGRGPDGRPADRREPGPPGFTVVLELPAAAGARSALALPALGGGPRPGDRAGTGSEPVFADGTGLSAADRLAVG